MTEKYYIYYHVEPLTEEIVYIGIGTYDRAWQVNNRSKEHKEWLRQKYNESWLLDVLVWIVDMDLPKEQALIEELKYIDDHRPRFNKNYKLNAVCKLSKEDFELATQLRKEGMYYKDIAAELKVSPMTIHRALSGGTKKYEQYQ